MSTTADADKVNILIVDDLPEKLLVYQSILEALGENLVAVSSGGEALKQVLKGDFAVILLDVNMPGMDGFETAQLIRQRKRSAHTPIIFLTAFADEVRAVEGYAHGAVDYILTPVVPQILKAKIKVFVDLFRMRLQVAQQAEEQMKRAAAEEAARRSAFLAEASSILNRSLDFETTFRGLARLVVPSLADLSLVCLADEHGQPGRIEWTWVNAAGGVVSPPSPNELQLHPRLREALVQVLATGEPEHLTGLDSPVAPAEPGRAVGSQPDFAVESALVRPLIARSNTVGALVLAVGPSRRRFKPADVALADDLSGRAGIALDNALLVHNIQENDRRKNEFLAMLAHELRNPLAPIRNAIQVLQLQAPHHPELDWAREIIDRQVAFLVRMVDDLLDVSRITRGKIKLQPEVLEVEAIVKSAVETSRSLIEAHAHELTVSIEPGPLRVKADPARLAQILANLLNNAAKYTPDGGRIWLTVRRDGSDAVFRVRDTGPGIPREMLSKVFDLFTQVDRSLDRSQGGLGIGLTLVRRLVELHEGSVQAHSDGPGQGSEFVVRLPMHASEQTAAPPCNGDKLEDFAPRRVLVVDDNVDAAESLALILRLHGHEVRTAHDGFVALEMAPPFQPEVILLDIGLPGLDGYQVARRLRAQPGLEQILLIAVSGYGQDEDRRRSQEAGFNHHLIKPVDFAVLQHIWSFPAPETVRDSVNASRS